MQVSDSTIWVEVSSWHSENPPETLFCTFSPSPTLSQWSSSFGVTITGQTELSTGQTGLATISVGQQGSERSSTPVSFSSTILLLRECPLVPAVATILSFWHTSCRRLYISILIIDLLKEASDGGNHSGVNCKKKKKVDLLKKCNNQEITTYKKLEPRKWNKETHKARILCNHEWVEFSRSIIQKTLHIMQ